MSKLSTTELRVMVENVLAKRIVRGGEMRSIHMSVLVRLRNAAAIEESCAALRSAELAS